MKRLAMVLLLVVACDKASSGGAAPGASASASTAASTAPVAASSSSVPGAPAASRTWRGTYKSAVAPLAVPTGWKGTHLSDTQPTAGVGDGAVALTIDGATGHVGGTVDGPLGPATLDGAVMDGQLAATLRRKDPTDQGFTGTVLGTVTGDHLEGTMRVSLGTGALRAVTFTLTPSGAAP